MNNNTITFTFSGPNMAAITEQVINFLALMGAAPVKSPAETPAPTSETVKKPVKMEVVKDTPAGDALTIDMLLDEAARIAKSGKRAEVKNLVRNVFKIERIPELPADQFQAFFTELKKLA